MPEPNLNDEILDNVVEINSVTDEEPTMAANMDYWQERLYKGTELYDLDAKYFENSLKSAHLEGKMTAREMTFAKGGGLPTVMPLPSGQTTHVPSVAVPGQ